MRDSQADLGVFRGNFPHGVGRLNFDIENLPLICINNFQYFKILWLARVYLCSIGGR